ncbi:antibiotic resistance ATP-binding protein [Streptomyces pristinaespiralis ATCC 25486]|uniref:ABC-type xenobiotic transporter n=1 Tax=Streptomyces pristinaespiralis (strain ATCC 25486 / DSM 40338 / CBS 914.69 / JCM 4507 / KCC S-0507 / NBRC 13074 / NRRL 2958 / 5647) TaxID=457429 RepID=B5H5G3_STRE2|nr:antibiotic resistance ATP-binding protein [Streptomyces pristinaespiralis ATCC 25486]
MMSTGRPAATRRPPPDTAAAIEAHGLRKSYGKVTVLDGVGLRVERGSVFSLLGPNGAGKTTTVRILATLTTPDAGHARVAGHDVTAERGRVRRAISLTGQFAAVDEKQTGEENLRMMARLSGRSRAASRRRAAELLERFDLAAAGRRLAVTYSGGMRRRLDLAAGLVGDPEVVFLDEPTTGLDPRSRQELWQVVRDLSGRGTTVFLTTQYLEEADRLADRVAVMDAGRMVAEGTAAELKAKGRRPPPGHRVHRPGRLRTARGAGRAPLPRFAHARPADRRHRPRGAGTARRRRSGAAGRLPLLAAHDDARRRLPVPHPHRRRFPAGDHPCLRRRPPAAC